jgi:hypothetical protein
MDALLLLFELYVAICFTYLKRKREREMEDYLIVKNRWIK